MNSPLGNLTWTEVREHEATVVVPVGSVEQHGPHLPLDTDTTIATAVAGRLPGTVSAPAIAYGSSGEHEGFAGTVSIGQAALETVLVEFGRSACRWAGRVLFVNGHGGNGAALVNAVQLLRFESRDVAWVPCAVPGADAHAGRTETSIMLYLDEFVVRLPEAQPGATETIAELLPRLRAGGVASVSPNGVLGDPTGASAAEGKRLFDALVGRTAAALHRWNPDSNGMLS